MRIVVIDTETTGLNVSTEDRVIEIGAVEVINGKLTDNTFQAYINPHRKSHPKALNLHRLTDEFLSDKPDFHEIEKDFSTFLQGADELVFFNRHFDKKAIRKEFSRSKLSFEAINSIPSSCLMVDLTAEYNHRPTLDLACSMFRISTEDRENLGHGALLDARLTAELYIKYRVLKEGATKPKNKASEDVKKKNEAKLFARYVQTARPIPRAFKHPITGEKVQLNFCKNPNCRNFGIPAENSLPPNKNGKYNKLKNDYIITQNKKAGVNLKCKLCGSQSKFINNKAFVDEAYRIQTLHEARMLCCPGKPTKIKGRRKKCRNSSANFNEHPDCYTIKESNIVKRGRRKIMLSQRLQCNACKTKFFIPTFGEHGQSATYHLNERIFEELVGKGVLNQINEKLRKYGCNKKLLYNKIDFIFEQCIEFDAWQVKVNIEKLRTKSLGLSMDRQHYLVNWNDKNVRKPTKILNTSTTDNESGFTFVSTLNFDIDADAKAIRKDSKRLKDHEQHEWIKKYARYLVTNDDVEEDTDNESSKDGDDIKTQVSHRGMLVKQSYSIMAHLEMMKPFYSAFEHATLYADDDAGFERTIPRILKNLIQKEKVFPVLVREEKTSGIDLLDAASRKTAQKEIFDQHDISVESLKNLKGEEYLRETSKLTKKLWLAQANSNRPERSQWLLHPFPKGSRVLQVKPLVNIFADHNHPMWEPVSGNGVFEVSTNGVDNYFQLIRRRVNMLERPITSATNYHRWNGYASYSPQWSVKLAEIFRVFNNYIRTDATILNKQGKSRKYIQENESTPAMRLGLVDEVFTIKDVLEFSSAKIVLDTQKNFKN